VATPPPLTKKRKEENEMKKAEQLRKITNEVNEQARAKMVAKHKKYADSIINGKCYVAAQLGKGSARVKLKKRYLPSLVVDALVDNGMTVVENSKNGRAILTIKW
jgi:isopentenyl phosphate kinase